MKFVRRYQTTMRSLPVHAGCNEAGRIPLHRDWTAGFILVSASPAFGQCSSGAARISGQVTDTSRNVMPGAYVQVRNIATNVVRALESNGVGRYEIVALLPCDHETSAGQRRVRYVGAQVPPHSAMLTTLLAWRGLDWTRKEFAYASIKRDLIPHRLF